MSCPHAAPKRGAWWQTKHYLVVLLIHTYIYTYIHTYIHTYIPEANTITVSAICDLIFIATISATAWLASWTLSDGVVSHSGKPEEHPFLACEFPIQVLWSWQQMHQYPAVPGAGHTVELCLQVERLQDPNQIWQSSLDIWLALRMPVGGHPLRMDVPVPVS